MSDRVEPLGDGLDEDGAAAEPRPKAHPVAGAVHERRREQRPQSRRRASARSRRSSTPVLRPAEALDHRVAVAPQHALRHAGRAAGVEDVEVVGRPLDRRTRRSTPMRARPRTTRRRAAGRCPSRRAPGGARAGREGRAAPRRASARTASARRSPWRASRCSRYRSSSAT